MIKLGMIPPVAGWCLNLSALLVGLALVGCTPGGGNHNKRPVQHSLLAAQVLVVSPRNAELDKDYPALLRSDQQVRVVARVSGILEKRHYNAGQHVSKGQKLFTIERAPYQAVVEQRKANLASAKAKLYNARLSYQRVSKLFHNGHVVSEQTYDNARADLQTAKAAVQQAQASLDQSQIDLNYTQVNAPVAGMISLSQVNLGNLVQPGQELATITPLHPIEARFSLPIEDATALRGQRHQQAPPTVKAVLHVPGQSRTLTGKIDYLSSRVNPDTGTVQARATFANPNGLFLPGQFVRVQLQHLILPHVLAVPAIAVTQGQGGSRLYVLGKQNRVRPQNVNLGDTFGEWVIVNDGLKPGARVVVNHIASVKPGIHIKPQPFDGNPNTNAGSHREQAGNRNQQSKETLAG